MDELKPKPAGNTLLEDSVSTHSAHGISGSYDSAGFTAAATGRMPGQARQRHLDALRSTLMVLGVFLHASFLYVVDKSWLVKDNDGSVLLTGLNATIHFFRIPCFLILSGYFSQMMLIKKRERLFLRSRMRRLALPLLSTAVLFNSMQSYFLHSAGTGNWSLAAFFASADYWAFWQSGEWIGHLWFLVYILFYSAVAAGAWAAGTLMYPRVEKALPRIRGILSVPFRFLVRHGLILPLLPLAQTALFAGASFLPFLYWNWGGLSGFAFLAYFPYYLFGLALFMSPRIRDGFHRLRAWHVLSVPAAWSLQYILGAVTRSDWARATIYYLDKYLVWCCCAALFAAFRLFCNRKSRLFSYLSEASYSIYLFHHACVVGLGIYMAQKDWNVFLEFGIILGLSLGASVAVHQFVVLRYRPLRLLFMGK